ncbi:MAG: hypothetical protein KC502_07125 [Myxococcales bacterium]|nr:hypothetical protein [Myxococcales bacterium]
MKKCLAILTMTALLTGLTGCYNTYQVPSVEFRKLQSRQALAQDRRLADKLKDKEREAIFKRGANDAVTVTTLKTKQVAVNRNTKIFVRSEGGRRYQVTPFNFSMYSSQLVASDRDTLLPLAGLKSYEVDLLSNGKTAGMIAAGVGVAAAFIGVIVATSGSSSFDN